MIRHVALIVLAAVVGQVAAQGQTPAATNRAGSTASVGLDRYTLKAGPLVIDPGAVNCSGVAFIPETSTLLVVQNKPTRLLELDLDGKLRRSIELAGFDDTEDVACVGKGVLAVVEERRRNLCVFPFRPGEKSAPYDSTEKTLVDPVDGDNVSIEGVAYDAAHKRFFIVKEKQPRKIYEVLTPVAGKPATITTPWDIEAQSFGCSDLSGIYFHAASGHLLILSDESKCVVEATVTGQESGRLSLRAGSAGMPSDAPQPEGITMDDNGNLYIVSEPNLLYIFARQP